ncbi:MAG TPA: SNF2-related protein, partial [Bryobacteraceae bacterium]
MSFELYRFSNRLDVIAGDDAFQLKLLGPGFAWETAETWPSEVRASARGRRLASEIAMALEMGLAQAAGDTLQIPYANFDTLDEQEFRLHHSFSSPSPFLLQIGRTGVLGRSDFQYQLRFLLGNQSVPVEISGPFLMRSSTREHFHLDGTQYALVSALHRFNALPVQERTPQTSWLAFADVKRLSQDVNASLDTWLASNDVVVPSSIGLDLYEESDGSLSFVPTSPDLDKTEFRTVFQQSRDAHDLYTVQRTGGERVRVVLTDRQKAVLQRMKTVQRVKGPLREALEKDPIRVFDGIAGDVELPESYSDRVIGIGAFEYEPIPKAATDESSLAELWGAASSSEDRELNNQEPKERPELKTLLIRTNQDEVFDPYLDQAARATGDQVDWRFVSPQALGNQHPLDPHQQEGVGWLQRCSQIKDRRGVLLADDMGLGKTLQLLTFMAWAIESGLFPELSKQRPPYRPILITAPLILLENQTWEEEMKKFFEEKGSIFMPVLPLYGPALRSFRRKDLSGTEGTLGKPILDLDRIRQHRIVITNYEALRDYEFSFAYHPDGNSLWSMVISDEAQEYKT